MRIHSKYFPPEIRELYNIDGLIDEDGYVYINITKGMYILNQSATIAYKQLILRMEPHGYYPVPFTTGLWEYRTRKTNFCLRVEIFCVKYFSKDDADHIINSLGKHYSVLTNCEGRNYLGLIIEWN